MKTIFLNTWHYLQNHEKNKFSVFILLDLFISFLDIVFLAALIWIVQFYTGKAETNQSFLPSWLADKESVALVVLFFLLFAIKNIAGIIISREQFRFNSEVALRISKSKLLNFQSSGFSEFINIDSSVHIRNIHFQPFEFCQYLLTGMQQLLTQAALAGFVITAILFFNAQLFFILMSVLLPPVVAVFFFIKKRMASVKEEVQVNNERSFQHLLDALKGYVEGNIYQANQFFLDRFLIYRNRFSRFLSGSLSLQYMPSRVIEISAILGLLLLIWAAKQFSFSDPLLLTIGAFMAAAYKLIPGLVKIINVSGQMKAYGFLFEEAPRPSQNAMYVSGNRIQSIELRNVCFSFKGRSILQSVNMDAEKGCFLGISGRSGSGKTTLLNILLGFYSPENGKVLINDIPRTAAQLKAFWPALSYVRQQNFLINDTILKNICFEDEVTEPARLEQAVSVSGLNEMLKDFPEGIHKLINENGKNISGGQQQRIAIARALYKNSDLVLLDEPFSELDELSETVLLGHFSKLAEQGKIVIMITHNKKALDHCHKIISIDEEETKNPGHTYAGISGFGGR